MEHTDIYTVSRRALRGILRNEVPYLQATIDVFREREYDWVSAEEVEQVRTQINSKVQSFGDQHDDTAALEFLRGNPAPTQPPEASCTDSEPQVLMPYQRKSVLVDHPYTGPEPHSPPHSGSPDWFEGGLEEGEEESVEALLEKITEVQGHLVQLLHKLDKLKLQGLHPGQVGRRKSLSSIQEELQEDEHLHSSASR